MPSGHLNGKTKLIPNTAKNQYKKLIEEEAAKQNLNNTQNHPWACLDTVPTAYGDMPMTATRQLNRLPDRKNNKDLQHFEGMCVIQCTEDEICGVLKVDYDNINAFCKDMYSMTFTEVRKKLSQNGKMSLRRAQYRQAIEKDNPIMQIWLGKQYLGQADKLEQEVSGSLVLFAGQAELRDEEFIQNDTNTNEVIDITEVKELPENSIKPASPDTTAL